MREDSGEASAGERIGQPLSRESDMSQGADSVTYVGGNAVGHDSASIRSTLSGLGPGMYGRDLQIDHSPDGVIRIGKARSRSR